VRPKLKRPSIFCRTTKFCVSCKQTF
jgi:hypothetical protein